MSRTRFALLLLFVCLGLAACNTMRGVGQDIQAAGEAIEDAGDDDN
jgi:predicted small secreted protein